MRWSEIPRDAKAYMLYHTIIAPQLIVWYLLPLYMMYSGYSVLEVGAFFTAVNIISIPLTYLIGRFFNEYPLKTGLILIDALDGIAYILYGFAKGSIAPLMLFLGYTIEEISALFYPLYQAYEQIIYPEDKYEEIFAWHLRLPEISQLIGFLILGYLFGYIWNTAEHYRKAFIVFGLFSVFTIAYLWKFLPPVGREERISPEKFTFKIDKEFKFLLLIEALFTLAWSLAPEIVLLNYVIFELHKTIFEVMLIEGAISVATIIATYVSERIPNDKGFRAIGSGMFLLSIYALIMSLSPPFWFVLVAYFIGRFGDTLAFPFYRSWMFSLIPKEKASEFHAALSSYRRLIGLFIPFIAGALASIKATLPYFVGLILFLTISALFIKFEKIASKTKTRES